MSRSLTSREAHQVNFTLNGEAVRGDATPRLLLSDFLRRNLGHTGTHVGCEHGVCGACTVLIDGVTTRACLKFAVQLEGRDVRTVEGLTQNAGTLNDIQEAFRRHHALQCGFCTPGILMSVHQFLKDFEAPSEREVRDMLSGHLCRCTGYQPIVEAVLDVAADRRAEPNKPGGQTE